MPERDRASHVGEAPRLWPIERACPRRPCAPIPSARSHRGHRPIRHRPSRPARPPARRRGPIEAAPMSGTWDRDEAGDLRRGAVRQAPRRDLRVPVPDDARPRGRRGHDPGRVRQGVQELRDAREAGERAGVAVPDRPPRRARRDPPPQDRPVPAVDRRVEGLGAVRRAPRHGRAGCRATCSGRWRGSPSASAPPSCSPSCTT